MKINRKRILKELEEMISEQVWTGLEVDVSAKQIFEKFIEPALAYLENKNDENTRTNKPGLQR